ncbi:MAG: Ig-like domain-containing protein, partial [Pseudomonadota bacterium]
MTSAASLTAFALWTDRVSLLLAEQDIDPGVLEEARRTAATAMEEALSTVVSSSEAEAESDTFAAAREVVALEAGYKVWIAAVPEAQATLDALLLEAGGLPAPVIVPETPSASPLEPAPEALDAIQAIAEAQVVLSATNERFITDDDGPNRIAGQDGADAIVSSGGADIVDGGAGADVILGGAGADTLIGGAGPDQLTGGIGPDVFAFDGEDDPATGQPVFDTITDFQIGIDTVRLSGFTGIAAFADLTFTDVLPQGPALQLPGGRFIVFEGVNASGDLSAADFTFETDGIALATTTAPFSLTDANDRYIGSGAAAEQVSGGAGADAIVTGDGADLIAGGDGADLMLGGAGADTLEGGEGADRYEGGTGADVFRLIDGEEAPGFVTDVIVDYQAGIDTIELVDFATLTAFGDLTFQQLPAGLAAALGGGRFLLFEGVTAVGGLTAADFSFTSSATAIPPELALALANDTGGLDTDTITADAAISGTASDDGSVDLLEVSLDGTTFVDISAFLQTDGSFALTQAELETALGSTLSDGVVELTVRATDDGGLTTTQSLALTLDSAAPTLDSVQLSAASDSGTPGDSQTAFRVVSLVGEAEAGAGIEVTGAPAGTVAGGGGRFTLSNVSVAEGLNEIELTITDRAGNSVTSTLEITGLASTGDADPVLLWQQIALDSIAADATNDTNASRVLALNAVAMYDVVAAIDDSAPFLVAADAPAGASLAAAVATASHAILSDTYPMQQGRLDAELAAVLDAIADGASENAGIALGQSVAAQVLTARENDGADEFVQFPGSDDIGVWRPTAPAFALAVTPQYADVDPWAMSSPDQFRPEAPLDIASPEFAAALAEVIDLGAADSTTRTAQQTETARFWQDGGGTYTTPGRWNDIALTVAGDTGASSAENARSLALLNVAIADSIIAAWDAKFEYAFWRPSSANADADIDGNPLTEIDPDFEPFLIDPAHPDYVSGHGAVSGAAAEVLELLYGDVTFETSSLGLDGVTRTYDTFDAAAQENADSRLFGGIHYRFSNEEGLDVGRAVAENAIAAFNSTTDVIAPRLVIDGLPVRSATGATDIVGVVLDALSGPDALTVSVDGAAPQAVTLEDDGTFDFAFDPSADGTFELSFVASDGAGNDSAAFAVTVERDSTAPAITLTGDLSPEAIAAAEDGTVDLVQGARLTGNVDGTGSPIVMFGYAIDGGQEIMVPLTSTGGVDFGLDLGDVAVGDHVLTLRARDRAGNETIETIDFEIAEAAPLEVARITPLDGMTEIGVTFRPEVEFTRAVDPATVTNDSFFASDSEGNKLPAQIRVSEDGRKAFMFFEDVVPGGTEISLTVDGTTIATPDGQLLDGDFDGDEGGVFETGYTTVSTVSTPGTAIVGKIVGPGPDMRPMTDDDFGAGPDGRALTEDDVFFFPIEGAEVRVLGRPDLITVTDENGEFRLENVPVGNVKVAVDGRTADNPPPDGFYPEMVMDLTIRAGVDNTLMGSMGPVEERLERADRPETYLPIVANEILADISMTEATEVGVPAVAATDLTEEERQAIKLTVQPGTAVDAQGNVAESAQVGISTVPPELVADMLPTGLLQHTFDLTIQAPGAEAFTTPAELTLPNVFDAPAGSKLNILSFDHTTGRLVIEGTATVSEDGKTVTTDPGVGITKPGWHGLTPPGNPDCLPIGGGGGPGSPGGPGGGP